MGAASVDARAAGARRILVVDDDEDILDLVALALELHGYAVETAEHGQVALERLARTPADLILLDLNMPVMDGRRFCEEKRRRPELDSIPLALMSAADNLGERIRPCTPNAILPKPFVVDDLLRTVATTLAA
jgi:CheY-like chemotaxis protein